MDIFETSSYGSYAEQKAEQLRRRREEEWAEEQRRLRYEKETANNEPDEEIPVKKAKTPEKEKWDDVGRTFDAFAVDYENTEIDGIPFKKLGSGNNHNKLSPEEFDVEVEKLQTQQYENPDAKYMSGMGRLYGVNGKGEKWYAGGKPKSGYNSMTQTQANLLEYEARNKARKELVDLFRNPEEWKKINKPIALQILTNKKDEEKRKRREELDEEATNIDKYWREKRQAENLERERVFRTDRESLGQLSWLADLVKERDKYPFEDPDVKRLNAVIAMGADIFNLPLTKKIAEHSLLGIGKDINEKSGDKDNDEIVDLLRQKLSNSDYLDNLIKSKIKILERFKLNEANNVEVGTKFEESEDLDLKLAVGRADFEVNFKKDSDGGWIADIRGKDKGDFTKSRKDISVPALVNNIGVVAQKHGIILPFWWKVRFIKKY